MMPRPSRLAALALPLAALIALAACSSTEPAAPTGSGDPSAEAAAPTGEPTGNDPYANLPEVPGFELTSTTVQDDGTFAPPQFSGVFGVPDGQDISPELSWSGFPEETQSFVVSVYDVDAPTGSGFWHWVVINVPASVTSLPENAGSEDGATLPAGSIAVTNDAGTQRFIGAAPPPGSGPHRYVITVTALDVPTLDVPANASPALVGFTAGASTIARASIVVTAGE